MIEPGRRHRLEGLEPDNLLAFLALLGLLRAFEAARPTSAWDVDTAPLRPFLQLRESATREAVCEVAAEGVRKLAEANNFGGMAKLKLSPYEARTRLADAVRHAQNGDALSGGGMVGVGQ